MKVDASIRQARIVSITALILILVATLFPFRFNFNYELQLGIATFFHYEHRGENIWKEPLANLLLFIPFGFGVAGLITRQLRSFTLFITTLGTGIVLSVIVEFLQLFILVRTTTVFDVITNGLGTATGYFLFYYYGMRLLRMTSIYSHRIFKQISLSLVLIIGIVYLIVVYLFWQGLYHQVSLANWNTNFPLILGNEKTGNRPWNGNIYKLYFGDFVLQEEDIDHAFNQGKPSLDKLLTLYQLDNAENESFSGQFGSFSEVTKNTGNIQAKNVKEFASLGFVDNSTKRLNSSLKIASKFTIGTIVQTENIHQIGPARIFTISSSTKKRNIMFGQDANDLIIRLRTPVTRDNGSRPGLIIPDVFADTKRHHLIVTYDGHSMRIYVDNIKQLVSFDLMEAAVAQQLFLISYHKPVILPVNQTGYLLFKYGLYMGFPLSLLWVCRKRLRKLLNPHS